MYRTVRGQLLTVAYKLAICNQEGKFICQIKRALDKYNINRFISNSTEELKLNQYWKFQMIPPMCFHFMRYSMNSIIFRVSHRLLYCVFIEVDFEKWKLQEISIFLQK